MNLQQITTMMLTGLATLIVSVASAEVVVDGRTFESYGELFQSDYFRENGARCGTPEPDFETMRSMPPSDCGCDQTVGANLDNYAPDDLWLIPVVVHVLIDELGTGDLTNERINSQIQVLNEDFRAVPGSPGENGIDSKIGFYLANVDPQGNPTTGVTRTVNTFWHNDQVDPINGTYYDNLAWDPTRYVNIYTGLPEGGGGLILGYVSLFAACDTPGGNDDRIMLLHSSFGRDSGNPPYDQGRTVTHEVGHYVGLYHTFQGGCDTGGCYVDGDLLCDTGDEDDSHGGCPVGSESCGTPDPIRNYMEYTDDTCMTNFTAEQVRRARCTIQHYRPDIYTVVTVGVSDAGERMTARLHQNRPNPFNPITAITFDLERDQRVTLRVLDATGRYVRSLFDGFGTVGSHTVRWNGRDDGGRSVGSGVYFYQLLTPEGSITNRMTLLK